MLSRLCSAARDLKGDHTGHMKACSAVGALIYGTSCAVASMASGMFDVLWIIKHKQNLLKALDGVDVSRENDRM